MKNLLQILRQLKLSMSEGHEHTFTLIKTDEEWKKGLEAQLTNAK